MIPKNENKMSQIIESKQTEIIIAPLNYIKMVLKYYCLISFVCIFLLLGGNINLFADEQMEKSQLNPPDMPVGKLLENYKRWVARLTCCEYTFKRHTLFDENGQKFESNTSGMLCFNKEQKLLYTSYSYTYKDIYMTQQILINKTIPFLSVSEERTKNSSKNRYSIIGFKNNPPETYSKLLVDYAGDESIMSFGTYKLGSDFISKDIYDSFKKMNLKSEKQQLNNSTIYKIIGEYNNRRYELWLNPEYEFMPIKISCCPLDRKINFFDFIVKDQTKIKDIFIPTKYLLLMESEYSIENKGKKETIKSVEKSEGEISNISLDFDFEEKDYKITLPVPDGTQADVQDALQIDHIWYKGKVVVKTDEVALSIARGNYGFIPGVSDVRFWFMLLSLIIVLVGFGLKIKSMIKNNNDSKKGE
ncbi:MAG: hypothetical protein LBP59_09160 [Planctomycetaceae bacterium]|jgi:hypothetical protein|nr:hypothetical protein [Planctomycetaceae bacterium]